MNKGKFIAGLAIVALIVFLAFYFRQPETEGAAASPAKVPAIPRPPASAPVVNNSSTAPETAATPAPPARKGIEPPKAPPATNVSNDPPLAAAVVPQLPPTEAQKKAITNNLRQLISAAQQFMLDKGATSASYSDLVGSSTDSYIRSIRPVVGEDYTDFVMRQTDASVSVTTPDGTTVTFSQ